MPSLHPPPLDARKNFLIDSTREYTVLVFSSRLFFPACLRQGRRGKWSCRAYRFPSIGPLSRQKRSSLFFFFLVSSRNRCRSEHRIRVIRAAKFVFQQRGEGEVRSSQLSLALILSHPRREREGEGRRTKTRDIQVARAAPSPTIARSECRVRARAAVAGRFPVVSYPRRGK